MKKLCDLIKKEIFHVLPLFLFFLISFTIINQVELFLFLRAGLTPTRFAEIALGAALIAKIVLAVDHLPLINFFSKKPLIYNIIWKTWLYGFFLLISRFMIQFVPYALAAGYHPSNDFKLFSAQFDWSLFWAVQVFYLMFLFIYVAFSEIASVFGIKKLKKVLFGFPKD